MKIDPPSSKKLSIVIPTYGEPQPLFRLLQSIYEQDINFSLLEIIIVSNLQNLRLENEIKAKVNTELVCRYFEVGKIGVNLARNLGLEKAGGEIILFLDDDCELDDPIFLVTLLSLHEKWPHVSGIGGCYVAPETANLFEISYQWIQDLWLERGIIKGSQTSALIGGNASYKKSIVGSELKFDERIDFGGAETELNLRLIQKGFVLNYSDLLQVRHHANINFFKLMYKGYKQGFSAGRRFDEGLVFETGRIVPSYETVACQYAKISNMKRIFLLAIFFYFDYIFKVGYQKGKMNACNGITNKELWIQLSKAPILNLLFDYIKWRVKDFVSFLRFSRL